MLGTVLIESVLPDDLRAEARQHASQKQTRTSTGFLVSHRHPTLTEIPAEIPTLESQ